MKYIYGLALFSSSLLASAPSSFSATLDCDFDVFGRDVDFEQQKLPLVETVTSEENRELTKVYSLETSD